MCEKFLEPDSVTSKGLNLLFTKSVFSNYKVLAKFNLKNNIWYTDPDFEEAINYSLKLAKSRKRSTRIRRAVVAGAGAGAADPPS
jgi:hypothetical protein